VERQCNTCDPPHKKWTTICIGLPAAQIQAENSSAAIFIVRTRDTTATNTAREETANEKIS
jgi:hypothetical protein